MCLLCPAYIYNYNYNNIIILYMTKFSLAKISPMAHTLYHEKDSLNLILPTMQGSSVEHSVLKILLRTFSPTTRIGEIGENFLRAKVSTYTIY